MTEPRLPDPIRSVPAESGTLDAVVAAARARRLRRLGSTGAAAAALVLLAGVAVTRLDAGGDGSQTIGVTGEGAGVGDDRSADSDHSDDHSDDDGGATCGPDATETSDGTVRCAPADDGSGEPGVIPPYDPGASPGSSHRPGGPRRSAEPSAAPSPHPTTHHPSAHPAPSGSVPPRKTPGPQPTPEAATATPTAHPTAHPSPSPTAEPSQEARGEMRRVYVDGSTRCAGGDQWCGSAHTAGSRPVDLAVRACRDAGAGPGRLESGPPGADFAVTSAGRQVWRWSSGQAFPAVVQFLDVEPGDCYEWSTTWSGVDDWNRRLPAGSYGLEAYVSSYESFPEPFRLTFTLGG